MKIETKKSLIIFMILFVILIPYSSIFSQLDIISFRTSGWHTTIDSFSLIANIIKLIILSIVLILYWKLANFQKEMKITFLLLHLALTVPSILITKIPLSNFVDFDSLNAEKMITEIESLNRIVIVINLLFLIGQILFGIYYFRMREGKSVE